MPTTTTYRASLHVSWMPDGSINAVRLYLLERRSSYSVGAIDPQVPPREMLRRCADRFIARRRLRAARGVPLPCL